MRRRLNWKGWTAIAAATILLFAVVLLATGSRVLIWETRVNPGQIYIAGEWGDLGAAGHPQLVCRYFTGRSIQLSVLWYSSNNIMGRDQCPFFVKAE